MKYLLVLVITIGVVMLSGGVSVGALSAKIAPLKYEAELNAGESRKGHVDIVNTGGEAAVFSLDVRAFRQVSDDGSLSFYDDARIDDGVKLDITEIELQPGEGARVIFGIDGTKLPEGDVFAAILVQSSNPDRSGVNASVSVGTLVFIQNGTPSIHDAKIESLSASLFQYAPTLSITMDIANPASESENTGFFPEVNITFKPYGSDKITAPLVFAGRTRSIEYRKDGSFFGPVLVEVATNGDRKSVWVFAVTGFWRWLAPILAIVFCVIVYLSTRARRKLKLRTPKR